MKKFKVLTKPTPVSELRTDDFYDELSSDLELKSERLQNRRWRKLRQEMA